MLQRQGFLIIEFVVALVVLGIVAVVVLRLVSQVTMMHYDIVDKTDIVNALCSAAEGGSRRMMHDARFDISEEKVKLLPLQTTPLVAHMVELKRMCARSTTKKVAQPLTLTVASV